MIEVEIARRRGGRLPDSQGYITKIKVRGHAGYAVHGEDIVCSAASAIAYTTAGALGALCGAPDSCAKEDDGFFEIRIPDFPSGEISYRAEVITETAYIGYKQIEASYASYLKVKVLKLRS